MAQRLAALTLLGLLLGSGLASAALPTATITYSGRLTTTSDGIPVANGTYTITFRLFDGETGGTALWSGQYDVPVNGGLFAAVLGPMASELFLNKPLWIELEVGASVLAPRSRLYEVPFATVATVALDATGDLHPQSISATGSVTATGSVSAQENISATGNMEAQGWLRAPIFYDRQDTNYYVDPASTSQMNDVRAHIFYDRADTNYYVDANGTSRLNNLSLSGNATLGDAAADAVTLRGDTVTVGGDTGATLVMPVRYQAGAAASLTLRGQDAMEPPEGGAGWVGGNITLRPGHSTGAMAAQDGRVVIGETGRKSNLEVNGDFLATGNAEVQGGLQAPVFYDRQDTSYYVDPASTSQMNDVRAHIFYDRADTNYYVDINGTSRLNNLTVAGTLTANLTLAGGSVTSSTIADGTVTPADLSANGSTNGQVLTSNGTAVTWQTPSGGGTAWNLTGNAGTTPGTNYVGTSDSTALEMKVNGQRALRLEPTTGTPNVVGGHAANAVTADRSGATIAGGGAAGVAANTVTDHYGVVGGGRQNSAGFQATVSGGQQNTAGGWHSSIGGGEGNQAKNSWDTVAGGNLNAADGAAATVGGGQSNTADGEYATVPGGQGNYAAGRYSFAAGHRALAGNDGAIVFADATDDDFLSTASNQFLIRAAGGVGINTAEPTAGTLDVNGLVRSRTGGFRFPDNTTQTTAATTVALEGSGAATSAARSDHQHDATYVNEGQAGGVTTGMIANGVVANAQVAANAAIAPEKIDGTAWTGANDGAGSGLDADRLDGVDSAKFLNIDQSQDIAGRPAFKGGAGIFPPFSVDHAVMVPNLNADRLDDRHAADFALADHGHAGAAWSGAGPAGLQATTSNTGGKGVHGIASAATGTTYGLYGESASADGSGVYGDAGNTGDVENYGGQFMAKGTRGRGVAGTATGTTGTNYGVYGESAGETGIGVYGAATGTGGANKGGSFEAKGQHGIGVQGLASSSADGVNHGGHFLAGGSQGIGVKGEAVGSDSTGVYGVTSGSGGSAVRGLASNTSNTGKFGGFFEAAGSRGTGVYAANTFSGNQGRLGGEDYGVSAKGDLTVTDGAFRGNIGANGGAPFPRPAYDSGWQGINESLTLVHNLNVHPDNYFIDLQMRSATGRRQNLHAGLEYRETGDGPSITGAFWKIDDDSASTIIVTRGADDNSVSEVRVRIWVIR